MADREHALYERFDLYLTNQLNSTELQALETELEQNPSIRSEFEAFLTSKQLGFAAGLLNEKNSLHAISTLHHEQKKQRRRLFTLISVAAAGLLIFFVIIFQVLGPGMGKQFSPVEIYAHQFEPPSVNAVQGEQETRLFESANQDFDNKKYQEALVKYAQIPADSLSELDQSKKALYTGVCHMGLEQFEEAIPALKLAAQQPEQAAWYTALSWLQIDMEKAREQFETIAATENHYFQEKAVEVLEALPKK